MQTPNLNLPLLYQHQSQKEVTVNQSLVTIDALLHNGVIEIGATTPPTTPQEGDVYVIGTPAQGDWQGKDGKLVFYASGWHYLVIKEGCALWDKQGKRLVVYDGEEWVEIGNKEALLGVNIQASDYHRLSVRSRSILGTAEEEDIQLTLNKSQTQATASLLFQSNYSTRAEIGCIGSDQFSIKVSPDGQVFHEALRVDGDATTHISQLTQPVQYLSSIDLEPIDLRKGTVIELLLASDCMVSFIGGPASGSAGNAMVIFKQNNEGNHKVSWGENIKWLSREIPEIPGDPYHIAIARLLCVDSISYGTMHRGV